MDTEQTSTDKGRELRAFLFLTAVFIPLMAVMIVGGYGFVVWIFQLINGPRPDSSALTVDVHIASLLVYAHPERTSGVERALVGLEGVEVHAASPSGKIVITLETTDESKILETTMRVRDLAGVHTANLVYHQVESAEALEESIDGQDESS